MILEECIVSYLENLSSSHPAVVAWGKQFVGGEDLFAFAEVPKPDDIVWVVVYSRERPDMSDSGIQTVRFAINARSYDYMKAITTLNAIADDLNGKEISCGSMKILIRGNPVAPTPMYLDPIERMVFTAEFFCEVRTS